MIEALIHYTVSFISFITIISQHFIWAKLAFEIWGGGLIIGAPGSLGGTCPPPNFYLLYFEEARAPQFYRKHNWLESLFENNKRI